MTLYILATSAVTIAFLVLFLSPFFLKPIDRNKNGSRELNAELYKIQKQLDWSNISKKIKIFITSVYIDQSNSTLVVGVYSHNPIKKILLRREIYKRAGKKIKLRIIFDLPYQAL